MTICHGHNNMDIFYYNVISVRYEPLNFFGRQCGYKVDIVTKYRTITYNCLFLANRKHQHTHELPFHIIEEHIQPKTQGDV